MRFSIGDNCQDASKRYCCQAADLSPSLRGGGPWGRPQRPSESFDPDGAFHFTLRPGRRHAMARTPSCIGWRAGVLTEFAMDTHGQQILSAREVDTKIHRLAWQILENHP